MKTIILTGFKPFGNYAYNPTEASARHFDGKTFDDRKVVGVVLPCIYDNWPEMSRMIREHKPHAIISTGLSTSAQGFRFESRFRNIKDGKYADANGKKPDKVPIHDDERAPSTVRPRSRYRKLMNMLEDEYIPVEFSTDAEGFICNSLGYNLSYASRLNYHAFRNIFVHVPWTTEFEHKVKITPEKMFLETELYHKGLELLIRNI